MKVKSTFGIITLVIVGSLFFVTCVSLGPSTSNPFKGTWLSREGYTLIFEDSSWRVLQHRSGEGLRGAYTYTKNTAIVTDVEITYDNVVWRPIQSEEQSGTFRNTMTISGNMITWGDTTYTRQ